ncbi:MAG: NADH-quinone oxidoreductase subunit I [Planctomycetota bacterium]
MAVTHDTAKIPAPTEAKDSPRDRHGNLKAPKHLTKPVSDDGDFVVLKEPRLTVSDQFYLPQVFKGLGTTMRHLFNVVVKDEHRVIQYPEERREDKTVEEGGMFRSTYRGVHRLNKDEEGRVKCVACFMCSTACPANCIHIEAGESPWEDREKYPIKFDIDELRCIYCGMCEEACPVDAIELTSVYDLVGLTRQEMIFDKSKLLEVYDQTVGEEPM